jgi:hypothetical protein
MSDIFFIVSSICVIVLSVLLGVLIFKIIKTIEDVERVVDNTKNITKNFSQGLKSIITARAIISPAMGIINRIIKNKKDKAE